MSRLAKLGLAASLVVLGGSFSPAFASDDPVSAEWLFIQKAESAQYADGELVLHGVDPTLNAFTDRPNRLSAEIDLPTFLDFWSSEAESFGDDYPNAGITMLTPEGLTTGVVELKKPQIVGDTLVYQVEILGGTLMPEGRFVSLFIDDYPTPNPTWDTRGWKGPDSGAGHEAIDSQKKTNDTAQDATSWHQVWDMLS